MDNYICKIASLEEVATMHDFYIENAIDNIRNNKIINYYGFTDGTTIDVEYYRKN